MKPAPFSYLRAQSLRQTVEALATYGESARIMAGGQSLGAMLNLRLARPEVIIDILAVSGLGLIVDHGKHVEIGATAPQAKTMRSDIVAENLPLLAAALPHVGHYQTRNRGTVGGSIAHADPSAEIPLALLVTGGSVRLMGQRRERLVPASEFFLAPLMTAKRPDEVLTASVWPKWPPRTGAAFFEEAMREGDFALVSCACLVTLNNEGRIGKIALGFGGIGDRPLLANVGWVVGKSPDELSRAALNALTVPGLILRDDLHASTAYRRQLMSILGWKALCHAIRHSRGNIDG